MSNIAKSWLSGKFRKPTQSEAAAMVIGAAIATGVIVAINLWKGEALFGTPRLTTLFTNAGKVAVSALPELPSLPIF